MNLKKNLLVGPILLLLLWLAVSELKIIDPFFLPSPIEIGIELFNLFASGSILPDTAFSLGRVLLSFAIALAIGLPLGLLLGSSKKVYERFEFVIDFFRSIPALALFPLFMLLFGIGDESKITVAAFSAALVVLFNTAYGVMYSKKARVLAAKLMGATKMQIFGFISFWESLPQTFVGIRIAIAYCMIVVVATEMFAGTYLGLGRRIIDAQMVYNVKEMYAAIFLTGLIGYLLNMVIVLAEKRLIHWAESR